MYKSVDYKFVAQMRVLYMSTKNRKNIDKLPKRTLKERLGINKKKVLLSLLVSFAAPVVLLICIGFSVFFANAQEFNFAFADFAPLWISGSLLIGLVFFISLIFTKGVAYNSLFAVYSFLAILGFIQNMVTTMTFEGMPGDGNATVPDSAKLIINFAVWVVLATVIIWFAVLSQKAAKGRIVISFLLVLVMVMQIAMTIPAAITYISEGDDDPAASSEANSLVYLTTNDMFEVSSKKNIIVIVLDRFDDKYFQELLASDSPYIDELDGFTYYADNISKYPRTYPAITSMLTGAENDFSSRKNYFNEAYKSSTFLDDIKANGYKLNLYIPTYYTYDNAAVFEGAVSNTSDAKGYTVDNHFALIGKMFELTSYFWAPEMFKSTTISSDAFNSVVSLDGDAPKYEMTQTSDAEFYDTFKETGLSTQSKTGTFTFLHLRGCHSPFTIDENCNTKPGDNQHSLAQTTGVFKFLTEYLQELKDLDLYEDATIIITGDHAALSSDKAEYVDPNLTGLLVKESGKQGTPMATSYAQVSQDNFMATIVKSAGIETTNDYGRAYSEIPEDETVVRTHYFQLSTGNSHEDENITYTIIGPGADFKNWKITNREDIGYIYN